MNQAQQAAEAKYPKSPNVRPFMATARAIHNSNMRQAFISGWQARDHEFEKANARVKELEAEKKKILHTVAHSIDLAADLNWEEVDKPELWVLRERVKELEKQVKCHHAHSSYANDGTERYLKCFDCGAVIPR